MSINIGTDKDLAYMCNCILFSHKKKWNCAIYRDVVEPRDCQTVKSEREGLSAQVNWKKEAV